MPAKSTKTQNEVARFKEALEARNYKFTRPRRIIAEKVLSMRKHFTAEGLYNSLRKSKSISRATVYRTLALLAQLGFVEVHDFGKGRRFYEYVGGKKSHSHFICIKCGKIIEFPSDKIESIIQEAAAANSFMIKRFSINVYGLCGKCAQK